MDLVTKQLFITSCTECPFHIQDDNTIEERWGKDWCLKLDIELMGRNLNDLIPIPKRLCPLPDKK
jgi:hypothetical protein